MSTLAQILANFETGDAPTQAQFDEMIKACYGGVILPQTIAFSATPSHNFETARNAEITLTADVTTYTLTNVPQGGQGAIEVVQNATGGFGITDFAHSGLTVQYLGGQKAIAANINSDANGHTLVNYYRSKTSNILYISFGAFNTSA
jgi:hypothetical protein